MNKRNIKKKQVALLFSIFAMAILVSTAGFVVAEKGSVCDLLGQRAAEVAKGELPFVKGNLNILAMTDSGYAIISEKVGGATTEGCIDEFTLITSERLGKG